MKSCRGTQFKFPYTTIAFITIFIGLYITTFYNYLLFHTIAELFSIIISFTIFIIAWNSRHLQSNSYFLVLGIAYFFVGSLDLLHTLGYTGMNIFAGYDTNLPTQLWIASRYMESATLFSAPFFLKKKIRPNRVIYIYSIITLAVVLSVFYWRIFPDCFTEGVGLTAFKKISEYVISIILLSTIVYIHNIKKEFDNRVLQMIMASIIITICSELSFTFYIHAYGISNMFGHFFKLVSFYLIYKAIIETGFVSPYNLLFRELKQSKDVLQEKEQHLSEVQRIAKLGNWQWNILSDELSWSDEVWRIFGLKQGEFKVTYDSFINAIHPDDMELVLESVSNSLNSNKPYSLDHRIIRPDGTERTVHEQGELFFNSESRPIMMIGTVLDITERREIENRLKEKSKQLEEINETLETRVQEEIKRRRQNEQIVIQQSKMAAMGEMIGAIAHQWRQPLNAVGIIIQDIKDACSFGELDEQYLDTSVRESLNQIQYMSKTIDDFRDFFRPSQNKEVFNISKAVKSAVSLHEAQLKHNNIAIIINSETDHNLTVNGYMSEFKQVVLNIISNARGAIIEARDEGVLNRKSGEISIDVIRKEGIVFIKIINNGKNIPEKIIGRIFEPYFTTKNLAEGTGIGLYMSKTIIEKHMEGNIYVKNIENGVEFIIELSISSY